MYLYCVKLDAVGLKGVKLEKGTLGKCVRSALRAHSVRAPSGCATTFMRWMGGEADATRTVSKSKGWRKKKSKNPKFFWHIVEINVQLLAIIGQIKKAKSVI